MDVRCDGVESRGVKVDGVKRRSGWWAEGQGTRILVCTPVLTLALPLVLGNVQQVGVHGDPEAAAILLCLRRIPLPPFASHASHHTSCKLHTTRPGSRFCFTPLVLQVYMLYTTRTAMSESAVLPHTLFHDLCRALTISCGERKVGLSLRCETSDLGRVNRSLAGRLP